MSIIEEVNGENNIANYNIIAHNAPSTVGSLQKSWPNRSFHDVRSNGLLPYEEQKEEQQEEYRESQAENYSREYYHKEEEFEEQEEEEHSTFQEEEEEEEEEEEDNDDDKSEKDNINGQYDEEKEDVDVGDNEEELERVEHLLMLESDNNNDENEIIGNTSQSLMIDDLGDRTKLFYHITYLNTQLQRLHLQNEELKRSLTLVIGMLRRAPHQTTESKESQGYELESNLKTSAHKEKENEEERNEQNMNSKESCNVAVSPTALTACLIAAHDERSVEVQLQQSVMKFDPYIAQTHIYKLDSTIAQLSMLRQVEVERLVKCEEELHNLHESHDHLMAQLSKVEIHARQVEHKYNVEHDSCRALQLEVEQLRLTERQLLTRLQELESFRGIYSGIGKSSIKSKPETTTAHSTEIPSTTNNCSSIQNKWSTSVEWEEMCARQELLQEMFWTPMCIAFDAGLTWVNEIVAVNNNNTNNKTKDNTNKTESKENGVNTALDNINTLHQVDSNSGGDVVYTSLAAPVSDVDLLVMQSLQEDVAAVRNELAACQADLSTAQLNMTRYQSLYTSERAKNITLQNEFHTQMERILQEVENDRQVIMSALQGQLQSVLAKQELPTTTTTTTTTNINGKAASVIKKINKDSDKENTVPQSLRIKQQRHQEEEEEEEEEEESEEEQELNELNITPYTEEKKIEKVAEL